MNDFLTEKNKKTGALGKLKWVLCVFCILFTLGAIGASEKYIGEGRWGMAATEIILGLLFLYPTFREIQKTLKKKKAREIACLKNHSRNPHALMNLLSAYTKIRLSASSQQKPRIA